MRGALAEGLVAHTPHLALLGTIGLAALILLDAEDEWLTLEIGLLFGYWAVLLPFFLAGAGAFAALRLGRRGRPFAWTLGWLTRRPWVEILLLRLPLALGLTAGTSYLYFTFKVNIPAFTEFTWDPFFATIDRVLFLGTDPWRITHALLPWAWATKLLDAIYLAWYFVLVSAIVGAGVMPLRHPVRLTFLLALGLAWVLGGVLLATLLPAAGPVYMEPITGDPAFRPLIAALEAQDARVRIMALEIQEWLWAGYATRAVEPLGISAFPSLHVAVPAICACLGFAVDRVIGWVLALFTAAVLVGSVHLGWHYAIDGIGGVAFALGCWWLSRRIVDGWLRRIAPPIPRRLPEAAERSYAAK